MRTHQLAETDSLANRYGHTQPNMYPCMHTIHLQPRGTAEEAFRYPGLGTRTHA